MLLDSGLGFCSPLDQQRQMAQSPVLCWKAIVEQAGGLTWRDRGLTGFSMGHLGIRSGASRYSYLHAPFVQVKVRRPGHKRGTI